MHLLIRGTWGLITSGFVKVKSDVKARVWVSFGVLGGCSEMMSSCSRFQLFTALIRKLYIFAGFPPIYWSSLWEATLSFAHLKSLISWMVCRYGLPFNTISLNILGEVEVVHVIADVGTVMNLLVSPFDKHDRISLLITHNGNLAWTECKPCLDLSKSVDRFNSA